MLRRSLLLIFLLSLCWTAVLTSFAAPAVASELEISKLVLTGESSPTGGTFSAFFNLGGGRTVTGLDVVTFNAGAGASLGLFEVRDGATLPIAFSGDPAPGSGGGTYQGNFESSASANALGEIASFVRINGGAIDEAIYLSTAGGTSPLVAAPTDYTQLEAEPVDINAESSVVFAADSALRIRSMGVDTVVAAEADAAPGTTGAFSEFFEAALNDASDVAFRADYEVPQFPVPCPGGLCLCTDPAPPFICSSDSDCFGVGSCIAACSGSLCQCAVSGGACSSNGDCPLGSSDFCASAAGPELGVFVRRGGVLMSVALTGEIAPGSGGGSYRAPDQVGIDAQGRVTFSSILDGGSVGAGIFREDGGVVSGLVFAGDVAPGTGGGTFSSFAHTVVNDTGEIVFRGLVSGGALAGSGLFLVDPSGQVSAVALDGETAPDAGGATFQSFNDTTPVGNNGFAFVAQLSGGTSGLYLASFPAVPAMSPVGFAAVSIPLLGLGLWGALRRLDRGA